MGTVDQPDITTILADMVGRDALLGATPQVDPILNEVEAFNRATGLHSSVIIDSTPPIVSGPVQPVVFSLPDTRPVDGVEDEVVEGEDEWWEGLGAAGQLPDEPDALRKPYAPKMLEDTIPHNFLSSGHGDTTPETAVKGDVVRSTVTGTWSKYGALNNDDLFTLVAGVPVWAPLTKLAWFDPTAFSDGEFARWNDATDEFDPVSSTASADHTLLDGDVHTDTVINTPTRGSLIYGNTTPKWDELTICSTDGSQLTSTGTDVTWSVPLGQSPWIVMNLSSGVMTVCHGGPGAECGCTSCPVGGISWDSYGHVRSVLCNGTCYGPCI